MTKSWEKPWEHHLITEEKNQNIAVTNIQEYC